MAEIDTQLVNIGLSPNDGTGNNIRDAFILTNQNITAITEFLLLGPKLANLTVRETTTTNSFIANVGVINSNLTILSNTVSTSTSTGALVVVGGTGIGGDLHVGGTVYGDIQGDTVTASTLGVVGDSVLAGSVNTGSLTVGTTLDPKDLYVTKNLQIDGTLTVLGNVVTVSTSEFKVSDPIIEIGGVDGATLSYNDGYDRGIKFYYFNDTLSEQQDGFLGLDSQTGKFVFKTDSLGTLGTARFDVVEANVLSNGTSIFNIIQANSVISTNGFTGELITAVQPNVTSVGTLSELNVNGNVAVDNHDIRITGGTLYVNGISVATSAEAFHGGTVSLDTIFISNTASETTNTGTLRVVGGAGVTGNLNVGGSVTSPTILANTVSGTLTTTEQTNITSVGILGNLEVANSISSYSASVHHLTSATSVNAFTLGGELTTAAQPNITSVGSLTDLTVIGDVTAHTFNGIFNGVVTGSLSGNITGSANTVTYPAQTAITSVGNLSNLVVTGSTTTGSLTVGVGGIETTGNITTTGNISGAYLYGQLKTPNQPFVTSVGTLSSLSVSGTSTLIGAVTIGSQLLTTGAGTQDIGTGVNRFGTIYSTSVNSSGSIIGSNLDGIIGAINPAAGTFTTINSSGQIWNTSGGIKFPDGTVQTTAGVAGTGSINYATTAGSVTNQTNSATITATSANTPNTIALRDVSGNFSAGTITANLVGTATSVTAPAQPLITSVGSLTSLNVVGAVTATTFNGALNGHASLDLPLTGGSLTGALTAVSFNGPLTGSVTGHASLDLPLTGGTLTGPLTATAFTGPLTGSVTGHASLDLPLTGGTLTGPLTATAFTGPLTGSVTGNVTGSVTGSAGSCTGNSATATTATNLSGGYITTGNNTTAVGTVGAANVQFMGSTTTAATVSFHRAGAYAVNMGLDTDNVFRLGGWSDGASVYRFSVTSAGVLTANTFVGVSTQARYADLAEMYESDEQYEPGTVLVFGGEREVTAMDGFANVSVAGVVSTNPAYLMNKDAENAVPLALRGKVPVKVIGPVRKGDLLVTSHTKGYAESVGKEGSYGPAVFAKSLEDNVGTETKIINAVIL